jgi:enamine deaminase RidA (YjgF/YER057c/UK114 family)
MTAIEHPRAEGLLHNSGFSQLVIASGTRTIYTAGQVSIDERGTLIGAGDLAAQTTQAMRNVGLALTAAGATYADIVKITTYVVNYKPEHRTVVGAARAPFFANGTPPASTLVGVRARAARLACRDRGRRYRRLRNMIRNIQWGRPLPRSVEGSEGHA